MCPVKKHWGSSHCTKIISLESCVISYQFIPSLKDSNYCIEWYIKKKKKGKTAGFIGFKGVSNSDVPNWKNVSAMTLR